MFSEFMIAMKQKFAGGHVYVVLTDDKRAHVFQQARWAASVGLQIDFAREIPMPMTRNHIKKSR